jgi:pimeloyl-ACP methyl ester carboxylesterase
VPVHPDFYERYDAVMARWPVPHTPVDLPGRFGTTHVNVCGAEDGFPVVLLPGGGATSAVWYAAVGALAPAHRVYAIDLPGDAGRSVADGERLKGEAAWMAWLDETLDELGLGEFALGGHSLGAWLATRFAVHAPQRVSQLVLFDPTDCLSPTSLLFRLRAVPLLVLGGEKRKRSFHHWETGGRAVNPEFLALWAGRFGGPRNGSMVWPKRPPAAELAQLQMPVLVFAAAASKQNNGAFLARRAGEVLADARVVTVPDASHFMLPQECPYVINPELAKFLAAGQV